MTVKTLHLIYAALYALSFVTFLFAMVCILQGRAVTLAAYCGLYAGAVNIGVFVLLARASFKAAK